MDDSEPTCPRSDALPSGISVVVPVYNSEASLRLLVERTQAVLETLHVSHEMILVDDGSCDESWSRIEELTETDRTILGVNLMRNFGQHNALLCGLRQARYDVTVTLDDDLQHSPEEIPRLLATLAEGYDVVYGSSELEQRGVLRLWASRLTKLMLQRAMGVETARRISAFRAMRTSVRTAFASYDNSFVSLDVLLTWATQRFKAIQVSHSPRSHGESTYTFHKLIVHAFSVITGFSVLPLQLASIMGFSFTSLGVLLLAFVLVRYVVAGGSVPGFPFLASIVIIFSGAQLLSLGILGEYVARIHSGITRRPTYVVRCTAERRT